MFYHATARNDVGGMRERGVKIQLVDGEFRICVATMVNGCFLSHTPTNLVAEHMSSIQFNLILNQCPYTGRR